MDSQGDPSLRSSGSDGGGYIGGGGHTVDLESMESGETPVEANHNHSQSNVSVEGPYFSGGAAALRISSGWMRNPSSLYEPEDKEYKRDLPLRVLAWRVSPAALCIFLSVGTSMLVFPFFTYVHSTGLLGERLPQVRTCCWVKERLTCRKMLSLSILRFFLQYPSSNLLRFSFTSG